MKKSILLITITALSISLKAQQLPPKLTITLTDKQVLRLDSAINFATSMIDSKAQSKLFIDSFKPVYEQISKQLIKDTTKTKKP